MAPEFSSWPMHGHYFAGLLSFTHSRFMHDIVKHFSHRVGYLPVPVNGSLTTLLSSAILRAPFSFGVSSPSPPSAAVPPEGRAFAALPSAGSAASGAVPRSMRRVMVGEERLESCTAPTAAR